MTGGGFIIGAQRPIAKPRSTKPTETPSYGVWEYYSRDDNGTPDIRMVPIRWMPGEAWALIDGAWKQVDSAEVGNEARTLDKQSYESIFGTLIALPDAAFRTQRD